MQHRKFTVGFIVLLIIWLPAACSHAIPPPQLSDAYVIPSGISNDGETLHVVAVGSVDNEDVNVFGLDVDLSCAESQTFNDTSDLRIELLDAGCAKIIGTPRSANERAAQEDAKARGIGEWSPSIGAKIARVWAAILRWFARDWQIISTVVGILLGLLSLTWISKYIDKVRKQRLQKYIHVIIIGAVSAGKTDLWTAWRTNLTPKVDAKPTVGAHHLQGVRRVPYGEFTIHPTVTDTAGSEPWLLMEQIREVPAKSKIILVIVVAPCGKNEIEDGGNAYDKEFIAEQKGYANLPRAVLGERNSVRKPDFVVMFITKFDLVSPVNPYDSQSRKAREGLEKEFEPHRNLIERICKERKIAFELIVGSSKEGWGIQLLKETLERVTESSTK